MRRLLGLVVAISGAWLAGLAWFAAELDRGAGAPDTPTDAIVVLTGGSQRIEHGMTLLVDGKAKKLFISGVNPGVDAETVLHGIPVPSRWIACCVALGYEAADTKGNAVETALWLKAQGYRSIRLVTANYHMPRALLEFRRVLPPEITIIADPVFPEAAQPGSLERWPGAARIVTGEYMKYLGAVIRPLVHPA